MQTLKKLLIAVLVISTIIEFYLAVGTLFYPEKMMGSFGITVLSADILYMACVISWFCLVVTVLTGLATYWIHYEKMEGYWLSAILGFFWLGIGLHLGLGFARPQHLVLDAAKGALILVLTFVICRKKMISSK